MNLEKELDYGKLQRNYVKSEINWDSFYDIEKYFKELLIREIKNATELKHLIIDYSEFQSIFSEREGILFINMTCFTNDNKKQEVYQHFINNLKPEIEKYRNIINKKIINLSEQHPLGNEYNIYIKRINNNSKLFNTKNVELQKEDTNLFNQYTKIQGNLTCNFKNKKYTLQQMSQYLESTDRNLRKEAYENIWIERNSIKNDINDIFIKQINIRNQIADNLNITNYVNYKFLELERFDYTPNDCFSLHNSIKKLILPINEKFAQLRKEKLNISTLKPFDLNVDIYGSTELKPFNNINELLEKTFIIFNKINPLFAKILTLMNNKKLLDLESREGKSPGGYAMILPETKLPFIFMNAVGVHQDVLTIMHEAGHAFNNYLTRNEKIFEYIFATQEIGEVASMSMELITMEHWNVFYNNRMDFIRAKLRQFEGIIKLLPWIVAIDSIQHWIYTQKNINAEVIINKWISIYDELYTYIDYTDYEINKSLLWQNQIHIFGMPFYYIEYAIAQIGAFNFWINYKKNNKIAIDKFIEGFSLGGRKPLPELFKAVGISFDFSENNLKILITNLQIEINNLIDELKTLENKN